MSTSPSITRPTHVLQAKQRFNNRQHSSRGQMNEGHAAYPQMPALQVKGSSKPASTPASKMYVSCTLNPLSVRASQPHRLQMHQRCDKEPAFGQATLISCPSTPANTIVACPSIEDAGFFLVLTTSLHMTSFAA